MKASYRRKLSIDIETYSSEDISNGVYKYASNSDFELLLFAYAYDDEPAQIIDLKNGEEIPFEVLEDIYDDKIEKHAFNAQFERVCLSRHFNPSDYPNRLLSSKNWHCTSVLSATLGLPASLEEAGEALKLSEDKAKLKTGKALIKYFCLPCKPTRTNGMRSRNLPQHDPEKWQLFKDYCIRDVETEREISNRLIPYNYNENEQELYELDQRINDRGIQLDRQAIQPILAYDEVRQDTLIQTMYKLTGLANPNSISQLKGWVEEQIGYELEGLTKDIVKDLLTQDLPSEVETVLKARQELGKTSITKYAKMQDCILETDNIHGVLQFYGANRTGRWAGRLVQVQNLPQNKIKELDEVRQFVRENNFEALEMMYDNVSDLLSQLIRTMFIPKKGMQFAISDFSAIEARVIAWLADEKWRLEVFATHGKIYEASASKMFNVPIEEIGKGSPLRQKGKVAELACGYQGGPGALKAMGADKMGLSDSELNQLIEGWRKSNPNIVSLWKELETAVKKAIKTGESQFAAKDRLKAFIKGDWLFIRLPSGRHLAYAYPDLEESSFGDKITYMGMSQTTNSWCRQDTYGGKLVENVVQAIARDCLADSMLAIDALNQYTGGLDIVMHVHDEIIVESDQAELGLLAMEEIMKSETPWAKGLQLKGDGFIADYYKKD